jgi:nitroreductase
MEQILEKLNWRYATKVFDKTKKLSDEQLHLIKESLRLSPSSSGIQPWKFVEVKSSELREKIKAASWGQAQVSDASSLFVLCTRNEIDEIHIDKQIVQTANTHGMSTESLKGYKDMMMGILSRKSPEELKSWARAQVYIALGFALATAAQAGIDACPMEGFDNAQVDEILGLKELGLSSAVFFTVGFRSTEDVNATRKKVRFEDQEVFVTL